MSKLNSVNQFAVAIHRNNPVLASNRTLRPWVHLLESFECKGTERDAAKSNDRHEYRMPVHVEICDELQARSAAPRPSYHVVHMAI